MSASTLLVLMTLVLGAPAGTSLDQCSISVDFSMRWEEATYFIGMALPDTVRAGKGALEYTSHEVVSGRIAPGPIYGQFVHVERLGGWGAEGIEQAMASSSVRSVVVVPWAYDTACEPIPWYWDRGFAEPGKTGFYTVVLREREHWVNETPTLDAFHAYFEPYPWGMFYQDGYGGTDMIKDSVSLSATEFFDYYAALPTLEDVKTDRRKAYSKLEQWADEHPDLAHKYPARDLVFIRRPRRRSYR